MTVTISPESTPSASLIETLITETSTIASHTFQNQIVSVIIASLSSEEVV